VEANFLAKTTQITVTAGSKPGVLAGRVQVVVAVANPDKAERALG
jgi:hypothetical protein